MRYLLYTLIFIQYVLFMNGEQWFTSYDDDMRRVHVAVPKWDTSVYPDTPERFK